MKTRWPAGDGAREAYEAFAPVYDDFNRAYGYKYEHWTGVLLEKAEERGIGGRRLLDVGCGTGFSFLPMLERGWQVTGCDVSPAMIEIARAKVGHGASLRVADMRELPSFGKFDLIWVINDPINYLLSTEELEATLKGIRQNLAADGIAVFDVNTLVTYRGFFSGEFVVEGTGRRFVWRGRTSAEEVAPRSFYESRFEATDEPGAEGVHRQRHFSEDEVLRAIEAAGLRFVALYGEQEGDLYPGLDEEVHSKAVYLCRR
ncbi:MAG TPA: class I SAM-dependent methyltransferase [Solirubrobacterales bacterium]|nr:class I SAM-dependent methyltransferase [Solirubrobacterales bacterium]